MLQAAFKDIKVSAPDNEQFSASLRKIEVCEIPFYECRSSPAIVAHEPGFKTQEQNFLIKSQASGHSVLVYEGGRVEMGPGDYIVCDCSKPFTLMFDEATNIISSPVSFQYLRSLTPFPQDICFNKAPDSCPIRRVVNEYLTSIVQDDIATISVDARKRLVDTYFELALLSILEHAEASGLTKHNTDGLFFRCCSIIRKIARDEAITVKDIASACGISVRYLQGIFAERGLTVTDYLINVRLDEARYVLIADRFGKRSIGEIAYAVGFKSHAHFSRAFKAQFGCSPTELRTQKSSTIAPNTNAGKVKRAT